MYNIKNSKIMEIKLTKRELELVMDAVDNYIQLMCYGEVDGSDEDVECLSNVFIQLNNSIDD